ncbi:hypothetical protein [Achromobacter sp. NFACC18-2]|uniref:hypothetical protein n=1 Tax=Achromobacter sp. NFACC18-2 TaxID=1564112 RepID=UPI0008C6CE09|nr:hypothetical protein [Achromobacter sp. NFACC18-2]SEJ99743.1 hypothetical protein SAMN03159494_04232 [Achromobacter sp. NFACC18-2]
MTTKHTPGNWTAGKTGGTVVSDQPLPNYTLNGGHDHVDYYGGHLIAESIWRAEDARLIAAAPELLSALEQMLDAFVDDPLTHQYTSGRAADAARDAIAKARGAQ